jgi:two-component system NtrC family sensor kinase
LISNAVDAMAGSGRLTLRTDLQDDMIAVAISDTGCGIPKHLVGKIFDPFVTTKDPGKGTGLGLSIVYKIVSRYGGRIGVDSEEGKGATFTVKFPWQ